MFYSCGDEDPMLCLQFKQSVKLAEEVNVLNASRIEMEEPVRATTKACKEIESLHKQAAEGIELRSANADLRLAKSKIIEDAKAHAEMLNSALDTTEKA